jgi:SnoaL-like protein
MSVDPAADRSAIVNAVACWALWRDSGRWDKLVTLYTPDAIQHTTWFVGPASEFIARIAARPGGGRSQHFVGACAVELNGDRAIAETRLVLLVRGALVGAEVDVTCYGRSYDRFVRTGGAWRIAQREMIYDKDRLDPVDPAAVVKLNAAQLARHPIGYRHLAYLQAAGGAAITPDLPTPGSEALTRLYAEGERWLRG